MFRTRAKGSEVLYLISWMRFTSKIDFERRNIDRESLNYSIMCLNVVDYKQFECIFRTLLYDHF